MPIVTQRFGWKLRYRRQAANGALRRDSMPPIMGYLHVFS